MCGAPPPSATSACGRCGSNPLPAGSRGTATGGPEGGAGGANGAGGVKGAPGTGPGTCAGSDAPTACGGGVSPGNGGTGPLAGGGGAGAEPECGWRGGVGGTGESPAPEDEDDVPDSALPEAFCVYQAGGA